LKSGKGVLLSISASQLQLLSVPKGFDFMYSLRFFIFLVSTRILVKK
jgi:hypothetical protein